MEQLNIKKERETIKFEELLDIYGEWIEISPSILYKNSIKELKYCSMIHDYFIYQSADGEHTLYRNKKK